MYAQELPKRLEDQAEAAASRGEELSGEEIASRLAYYAKHPLELNAAGYAELYDFPFLTPYMIRQFLAYRSLLGKLVDIYELQAVPGWDSETILLLQPYITLGSAQTIGGSIASRIKSSTLSGFVKAGFTLEKARGFDDNAGGQYSGDRLQLQFRMSMQYKDQFYAGILGDKDAGESLFGSATPLGFDFYSAHVFFRDVGPFKVVAAGDYLLNMGQGLVQWQSFGFSKSAEVLMVKKEAPALLPYRSASEWGFNRGLALSYGKRRLEATLFFSSVPLTANRNDSLDTYTGINTSGLHRTAGEIEGRNALSLFSFGGIIKNNIPNGHVALNFLQQRFSGTLLKRTQPYTLYTFNGNNNLLGSLDYAFTWRNLHFFGETAFSNKKLAFVHGSMISLGSVVDLSILHRQIPAGYNSLTGKVFSESSSISPESGFYTGMQLRPLAGWVFSAYADFFSFPWLRYRVSAPSAGSTYFLQLAYAPDKFSKIQVAYRAETKNEDVADSATRTPEAVTNNWFKASWEGRVGAISCRLRGDAVVREVAATVLQTGFSLYLEGGAKAGRLTWKARVHYFDTDGFASSIYLFEPEPGGASDVSAYFGNGLRHFLKLEFKPRKGLVLSIKWSQTLYFHQDSIGSGQGAVEGSHLSSIKAAFGITL